MLCLFLLKLINPWFETVSISLYWSLCKVNVQNTYFIVLLHTHTFSVRCTKLHKLIIIDTLLNVIEKVEINILLFFFVYLLAFLFFLDLAKVFCFNCELFGVAKFDID